MNTSELGNDSSSSETHMTNTNVTLVTDPERGPVASFSGSGTHLTLNSSLTEMTGTHPRTFSVWLKYQNSTNPFYGIFATGGNATAKRFMANTVNGTTTIDIAGVRNIGTAQIPDNTWTHFAVTSDNTNIITYVNGVVDFTWSRTIDTDSSAFTIGLIPQSASYIGLMSDFRFFGTALTPEEIVSIYNDDTIEFSYGSNGMDATPGVFSMNISWSPKNLARNYKINYVGTDSSEGTLITSVTNVRVGSLTPNTEYVFTLYYSEASSFSTYGDPLTINTSENTVANYNTIDYEDDTGGIDLTSLEQIELDLLGAHMNDLFADGTIMKQKVQGKSLDTTFVKIGSIVDATSKTTNAFSLPFTTSSGSGQEVTISTSTEDISVLYDETTNQVTINGVSYSNGESLIVDGKKMIVYTI
ncbi:unnamed protein product [Ectocarpus sp. 12 AP-2014]